MGEIISYHIDGRRCHGMRGIKLHPRKFTVQRLRVKFLYFLRILGRSLRSSFGNILRLLKRYNNSRNLVRKKANYAMYGGKSDYRLKSFTRSNSFYAEAIADCLDFIKENSLSLEEMPVLGRES